MMLNKPRPKTVHDPLPNPRELQRLTQAFVDMPAQEALEYGFIDRVL